MPVDKFQRRISLQLMYWQPFRIFHHKFRKTLRCSPIVFASVSIFARSAWFILFRAFFGGSIQPFRSPAEAVGGVNLSLTEFYVVLAVAWRSAWPCSLLSIFAQKSCNFRAIDPGLSLWLHIYYNRGYIASMHLARDLYNRASIP